MTDVPLRFELCSIVASAVVCLGARDASAQTPPPTPTPTADATVATDAVMVRIESPERVELEVQEDGRWHVVCSSPCGKPLSPKLLYRIVGNEIRTSEEFHLEPGKIVKLDVEPAAKGGRTGGVILIAVGLAGLGPAVIVTAAEVVALFGGLILICPLVAAFAKDSNHAYGTCLGDIATGVGTYYGKPYVWIPAAAGGVVALGGLIWLGAASSASTKVTQTPSSPTARREGDPAAWRVPEWNAPAPPHTRVTAIAPLVGVAF